MNISDELQKLRDLHRSGALTDEEFAAAKAAVLAKGDGAADPADDQAVQHHLAELKRDNEVARLDREWELERERYLVVGRYGNRYVPNRGMSVLTGVALAGFGILWTTMASSMGGGFGLFPLFGVLFILFGVGTSIYSFSKAGRYEEAYQAYQRRRCRLLAGGPERDDRGDPSEG